MTKTNKQLINRISSLARIVIILFMLFGVHLHISKADSTNYTARPQAEDSDKSKEILWLARAIYSESKNKNEQNLVAWVIRNRVETGYQGRTYEAVVLAPNQFSGLNQYDKQYSINTTLDYGDTNKAWRDALEVARKVYEADDSANPFPESARHFYSPQSVRKTPEWAKDSKPILVIGGDETNARFAFYKDIR